MLIPDKESLFFLMCLFLLTQAKSKLCHRKDDFKLIETELGTNPSATICVHTTNHSHHQPIVSYDNTNYTEYTNSSGFHFTIDNNTSSHHLYHLHFKNISVLDYRLHHVIIYNLGQEPVVVDVFIQPTDYDGDWSMFLAVYLTTGFFLMAVLTLACTLHEKG
ncbi:uncharacterized protein LOC131941477 [Physella acuta]|uniref:uncharacterized protein LOC131941477 n=1 Tax=Physella acuta TaxID=109671 RepID=UPI0027DD020F|nr:uncharacterized protein LOC131941477 [Physella acuta]